VGGPFGKAQSEPHFPGRQHLFHGPETAAWDRRPAAHDPWVRALAFSPDGRLLASGGCDHRIQLWDPGTGALLGSLGQTRNGVKSLAVSADGSVIASRQDDGSIRIFEGAQGRLLASRAADPGGPLSLALDPRAPRLFTGRKDGALQVWKVPTLEALGSLGGPEDSASNLSVSGDGRWLAWGGSRRDGGRRIEHIGFWNLTAGVPGTSIEAWGETADGEHADWLEINSRFLALSPDGRILAARVGHGAGLWEAETGSFLGELEGFDQARELGIACLAFSADGRSLAAGTFVFPVLLWDVPTRRLRLRFSAQRDSISCLAFSPDGKELAIGTDYSHRVWIHDVATGELTSRAT
jgi:WD40 repeat protein